MLSNNHFNQLHCFYLSKIDMTYEHNHLDKQFWLEYLDETKQEKNGKIKYAN